MVIYPGRRRHGTTPEIRSPAGRNRTGTSPPPDPAAMMPVPIIVTGDPYALPPSVTVIGDHNRRRSHHHRSWRRSHHHRSRGRSRHHRSRRRSHHHGGRCHGGTDQPDDLSCQMQTFIMMVSGTEKSSRSQKKQDRKNIFAFTHGKNSSIEQGTDLTITHHLLKCKKKYEKKEIFFLLWTILFLLHPKFPERAFSCRKTYFQR